MKYSKSALSWRIFATILSLSLLLALLWGYFHFWNPQLNPTNNGQKTLSGSVLVTIPGSAHISVSGSTPDVRPNLPGWNLLFDDEFNGSGVDSSKWNSENAGSGGYQNCCLRYGVQYFTPQALSFLNGSLRITTKKQHMGDANYTSGALTTENKFSFLYGRLDIRAKLPKTQGLWPAFWLLPTNTQSGQAPFEIDMMEFLGKDPTTLYMINHWDMDRQTAYNTYQGPDFSQKYHIYSMVWNAQSLTFYIDGVQRFQTWQGVSNKAMYLILNSTIGGSWAGNPDASTVLPQYLDIDYVRIYQPVAKQ
jgi:beta-glucanase (GH16 family)